MKQWKSKGNKRRCFTYLAIIIIFIGVIAYKTAIKVNNDFWHDYIGVLGITLPIIAIAFIFISSVKLWNLMPLDIELMKKAYDKVDKKEILTHKEQKLYANEEVMSSLFICGVIVLSIGLSLFIVYKEFFQNT